MNGKTRYPAKPAPAGTKTLIFDVSGSMHTPATFSVAITTLELLQSMGFERGPGLWTWQLKVGDVRTSVTLDPATCQSSGSLQTTRQGVSVCSRQWAIVARRTPDAALIAGARHALMLLQEHLLSGTVPLRPCAAEELPPEVIG